ncbi:ABC transporter permease [Pedobacter puniceum]|uniref:FtsX-like permease family protein n=1 Tax=Pedobacter puniceum TaxID=2666136 RepID=A0A7K0FTB5_9SPHI|nr:FtsX-like permease family protein [Pedobacter puniceum]MRX48347.1 FtsX-like permease family protein [Pedobacter puniceum]
MTIVEISLKALKAKKLSSFLSVLLVAFGMAIITTLILVSHQLTQKLERNAAYVDAVVGAKGSPLQLILSSVYFIDFPTGNIPLKEFEEIQKNRMVKMAVPIALGDSYEGYRIVGTQPSFLKLHQLELATGKLWSKNFEVIIGADVAKAKNIKLGALIYGSHGLTSGAEVHEEHAYQVVGILKKQNTSADQLVLTQLSSIWAMHSHENIVEEEQDITSILIQYRSPVSTVLFPKMVNEQTNLQAASPAIESARLFSLVGIGFDVLHYFAILIIVIAAISVFITLFSSLKERKYDLAVLRILGASKQQLFFMMLIEGIILTFIGALFGLVAGHILVDVLGSLDGESQILFSGFMFLKGEIYVIVAGVMLGIIASIIPAVHVYRYDIAKILNN